MDPGKNIGVTAVELAFRLTGGTSAVARLCGVSRQVASHWRVRGRFPESKQYHAVVAEYLGMDSALLEPPNRKPYRTRGKND